MKKAFITYILLLVSVVCSAAANEFTVKVSSSAVEVGQRFQVTFTINAQGGNFSAPTFDGLRVLGGPNQSQSMQVINGKVTQSNSISYVLVAPKKGTYTIGAASIEADGKTKKTEPVIIQVVDNDPNGAAAQRDKNEKRKTEAEQLQEYVFVKATVDKRQAYVGEKVTVTYKLYSRLNLSGLDLEAPTRFTGFWTQDLQTLYGRNIQKSRENYQGQVYDIVELQQTLLYPQRSGDLTIDALGILAKVQIPRRAKTAMEQFWGGGYDLKEVIAKSKPITLEVKPLPSKGKPANFSGAVGKFKMKMSANKDSLVANESVNVTIDINGTGNLPLIGAPDLKFPADFEVYDPDIKNNFKTSYNGSTGGKSFNYLVIPRHSGEFTLKPYKFSYFDVSTQKYNTITADQINIYVEKSDEEESVVFSGRRKEDVQLIGTDIRFIHINNLNLLKADDYFYGSKLFYLILVAIILFGVLLTLLAKRNKAILGDKQGLRKSKASKIAKKRLAQAKKHLDAKENAKFYEEISTALFGYFADKFNLDVADLSQEKIMATLKQNGHSDEIGSNVKSILEETEMARFAPESSINPTILYQKSAALIQNLES
ncbi:MAG: putative membrane protein [Vicingaceae bacterium]|jgi:uncharacterized membrane protein